MNPDPENEVADVAMKPRGSTVITALGYLLICGLFACTTPRFAVIFHDLLEGESTACPTYPLPTRIVLALGPTGWILLGVVAAALLVAKDRRPSTRKISAWPFFVLLVVLAGAALVALFLPLITIINVLS